MSNPSKVVGEVCHPFLMEVLGDERSDGDDLCRKVPALGPDSSQGLSGKRGLSLSPGAMRPSILPTQTS